MRMNYRVLHESTQAELEQKVNALIGEGWTPHGPAQVTVIGTEMQTTVTGEGAVVNKGVAADLAWSQTMVGMFPEPGDRMVEDVTPFRVRPAKAGDRIKARGFFGVGEVITDEDDGGHFKVRFPTGTQWVHFDRIEEYVSDKPDEKPEDKTAE